MILAEIDGNVVVLLLMAFFGFISWLSGKLTTADKQPPAQPSTRRPAAAKRQTAAESEEARMRRFLEALGMPSAEGEPTPQRPIQQPVPPPLRPLARTVARTLPAPPPLVVRPTEEFEIEVTSRAGAPLRAEVAARVNELRPATSSVPYALATPGHPLFEADRKVPIHTLLRTALSSPQHLRTAFVLREILGPPPGLRG